jgi:hypothetical protein
MTLTATCHCGATRITLPRLPSEAHTCNCSYCARTGAVWAGVERNEMAFVSQEGDAIYSASGGMNEHHFCSHCGIHTWGSSPDWSSAYNDDGTPKGEPNVVPEGRTYMVNLNLVDDIDWSQISIKKMDGRTNW